jgi:hypothetical protein
MAIPMAEPKKPMTHIVWAQYYLGRRFYEWVETGKARVEIDANGKVRVFSSTNRIPRGDNGYTCILPIGEKPPDPPAQPQRPPEAADDGEDF